MAGADGAVVFMHDFFDDGEAEAGAFGFVGDVGFERVFGEVGKAGAVVFDIEDDVAALFVTAPADARVGFVLRRFYRVFHEVDEDLPDVDGISMHRTLRFGKVEFGMVFAVEFGDLPE